ncbi:hypothetical protein B0H14DRAFT_2605603 [Mycena olivaceomarginata]|nr:hypothetical protein B0H14DRAFT_2605603 [Mycena olivaceomarginata]
MNRLLLLLSVIRFLSSLMCRQQPPPKNIFENTGGGVRRRQWSSFADTAFPTAASPRPLDEYIALIETLQLDSEPVLESVSYYRYLAPFGHALLLCRLRHPRWADGCNMAPASPDSSPEEVTVICTASADAELIQKPHLLCRTMTFPDSESSPPTLYDLLTLADVVRVQSPIYTLDNIPCIFFAETIYTGLERLFCGESCSKSKEGSPDIQRPLPLLMAVSNDYEDEINKIISAFPRGRREFGERMETHRLENLRWEEKLRVAAGVRSPPRTQRAWVRAQENILPTSQLTFAVLELLIFGDGGVILITQCFPLLSYERSTALISSYSYLSCQTAEARVHAPPGSPLVVPEPLHGQNHYTNIQNHLYFDLTVLASNPDSKLLEEEPTIDETPLRRKRGYGTRTRESGSPPVDITLLA